MTLAEKHHAVQENPEMFKAYQKEVQNRGLKCSNKGSTINGKKVGINTFNNALKYAAQSVYDEHQRRVKSKQIDLFEQPQLLPPEVVDVLNEFSLADNTYENCEKLVQALKPLGYTCDYELDAEPFNLRKINN